MKTRLPAISAVAAFVALIPQLPAAPMATAFTYQGRLAESGAPAEGIYDLRFTIYDDASSPGAVAGPLTNVAVAVNNGHFAVTLDFGAGIFTGDPRWLEIAVRTNSGGADFTTLSPRQLLTPAPYAIYAETAGTALSGNAGPPAGMGTVVFGTNTSSLDWVTNVTRYFVDFRTLTISGAGTNPANGIYQATTAMGDPTHPPTNDTFQWTNGSGWSVYQDVLGDLGDETILYAVVRPGPEGYLDRIIYSVPQPPQGVGWRDVWTNSQVVLTGYSPQAPPPYGVITAQRATNVSRYLSLRTDDELVGLVISGGGASGAGLLVAGTVAAAALAGDGAGISNVMPAGYQSVLASLNDARLPQGSVFKDMFATPPMGICTWPQFNAEVSEAVVKRLADGLYTNHLVELGWRLIQIDGGWQAKGTGYSGGRGSDGKLHWSPTFPNPTNTIKYLADRGIALGLYHEMDGGNEGMHLVGHMTEDVASFKGWGVTYLKLDNGAWTQDGRFAQLSELRQAMDAADWRAFIINGGYLMAPNVPHPEPRSPLVADAWRLSVDGDLYISENPPWGLNQLLAHFHHGMQAMTNLAGPGRYMDFDFLNLAHVHAVATPQNASNLVQTALSLWAIGPSSLMIDGVSDGILPFVSNRAMIAIHQDPLCLPGAAITQDANSEIWIRTLVDGDRAVCVVNKTSTPISPMISLASLGYVPGPDIYQKVYSVWDKRVLAYTTNSFTASVPAYSANLLRVSR